MVNEMLLRDYLEKLTEFQEVGKDLTIKDCVDKTEKFQKHRKLGKECIELFNKLE